MRSPCSEQVPQAPRRAVAHTALFNGQNFHDLWRARLTAWACGAGAAACAGAAGAGAACTACGAGSSRPAGMPCEGGTAGVSAFEQSVREILNERVDRPGSRS